jgi:spore germination protein KA
MVDSFIKVNGAEKGTNMFGGIVRKIMRTIGAKGRRPTSDQRQEVQTGTISRDIDANKQVIMDIFGESADLVVRKIIPSASPQVKSLVVHIDGMVDKKFVSDEIIRPIAEMQLLEGQHITQNNIQHIISDQKITVSDVKQVATMPEVIQHVISGDCAVFIDSAEVALICSTRGWRDRSIEEAATEATIRGPRDAFTETLRTNTSLIRRRIKDPSLRIEQFTVGRRTKTDVALLYIKGVVNEDLVDEAKQRLTRIDTDSILESGYMEEFIEDAPFSPFPTILRTERPDRVAGNILEGRVALMTDGTPFVLIFPATFTMMLTSVEDYYERPFIGSILRLIHIGSFFASLILPSLYIAITTFHQEMLPTPLILAVAAQREGVPFPAFVEAFGMELAFETLREAGLRLPKVIGSAVSIVGALIVGEAAIRAGLVSPLMVIVVAFTAIASFATPVFKYAYKPMNLPKISLNCNIYSNLGLSILKIRFYLATSSHDLKGYEGIFDSRLLDIYYPTPDFIPYPEKSSGFKWIKPTNQFVIFEDRSALQYWTLGY